jgi:hypothetical protein
MTHIDQVKHSDGEKIAVVAQDEISTLFREITPLFGGYCIKNGALSK